MPDVGPVADDNGGSPVGVGVEAAFPAPEHRLALAVIRVPVSAARAGLGRALRRDGDGGNAEFGGFLPQEGAHVADGRLGETFVEFSLGGHVLAGCGNGAAGGRIHVDVAQAFDGDHPGLRCQQDFAGLPAHFLVTSLGVLTCPLSVLGYGVASSFAVTGLAGDVTLVRSLFVTPLFSALVVGTAA